MKAAVLSFLFLQALPATELGDRLRTLIEGSSLARRGVIGMQVVHLESGKILFEHAADRHFVPASVTKLFTTALGLSRLGPDHRYQTTVLAAKDGSLIIVGGGDPNLSGRTIPYDVRASGGDPLAGIEALAQEIAARGVRRVDGDVIGDDTAFAWDPYGAGWSLDDAVWDYGAPVSALAVNDNTISMSIRPGDPARITFSPPLDYFWVDNRVREGKTQPVKVEREPGSRQIRVWGTLPAGGAGVSHRLAIDDPALYAALALREALTRKGVSVRGSAVARHWHAGAAKMPPPEGSELARRESPPLVESLRVIDKVSQNLHAEMLLRTVGRGTLENGLSEMKAFLTDAGVEPSEYKFVDGSGLSRMNLVTPAAVVSLLRFMHSSPHRDSWIGLMPVAGEDGTLRLRFKDTAGLRKIRAKTGALTGASNLAGYAESSGGLLAFAIFSNNQTAPAAEVRTFLDKLAVTLVE